MGIPQNIHVTYQLQKRKCGKSSCRRCKDGPSHGPYWYGFWNDGTRLRSGYIGKNLPAGVTPPPRQLQRLEAFVGLANTPELVSV